MIDLREIKKLSVEERILIVEEIWDSIAEDTTPKQLQIPEEEKKEILKRYEDYKSGKVKTYSWEEVKMYAKEP
jgi:putative addiction module component (TIGR02574 family)